MYSVNYRSGERCLSVQPVDSHFRVLGASVKGQAVPQKILDQLLSQANAEAVSSLKDRSPSPDMQAVPPPAFPSSPTSICSLTDDVVHSSNGMISAPVINKLRDLVFSLPSTLETIPSIPALEDHIPILISIEGNIGAGKSTLLEELRSSHPEWNFIDEPVDFWSTLKNNKGESLFELYYHNQERWSYTFQNCAVLSRYQCIENTISKQKVLSPGKQVYITERCLDTDHKVFAQMLHDDGKMDSLEYALYERWIKQLKMSSTPLSGIIYLDTPADVCATRIKGRNREGEEGIPLEYLQQLQRYQSAWIESADEMEQPTPIVRASSVADVEKFVNIMLLKEI